MHQGAARRCVLLDALGPLRGADGLRGGHLTGGDASREDRRCLFFREELVLRAAAASRGPDPHLRDERRTAP